MDFVRVAAPRIGADYVKVSDKVAFFDLSTTWSSPIASPSRPHRHRKKLLYFATTLSSVCRHNEQVVSHWNLLAEREHRSVWTTQRACGRRCTDVAGVGNTVDF
jgi:hypothetical protein